MALELNCPRGLGGILSTCLSLYVRHFLLFATLAFAVVLPIDLLLDGVAAGELWSSYDATAPQAVGLAGLPVAWLVALPLISANHARAVVVLGEGKIPPIGRTLLEGARLLPAVGFVVFLYDLGSFGGLIALIVPGVLLYVWWYVCAQASAVEGLRGRRALARSAELVRGSWWRVFGISIVLGLIVVGLDEGISRPLRLLADRADSGQILLAGLVLGSAVTYSFGALSATLLYFDLRTRQERAQRER